MSDSQWLAEQFEAYRGHLRGVAYRMLGSLADADDAVQDTWLRLSRGGADGVENLGGWLTTVCARVCLNMLRSRARHPEDPAGTSLPDPVIGPAAAPEARPAGGPPPDEQAVLADSVGLALLVVLDTLAPAERLAFVLHDMFDLPFGEIAPVIGRTPAAARQLASRARRRVSGAVPATPDRDPARQRRVVDAFLAAAREGDFDALVEVLDPGVVLRIDGGRRYRAASMTVRGSEAVARQALTGLSSLLGAVDVHAAQVNGAAGIVVSRRGQPITVMGFTVAGGRIAEIDSVADPDRLARIAVIVPDGG